MTCVSVDCSKCKKRDLYLHVLEDLVSEKRCQKLTAFYSKIMTQMLFWIHQGKTTWVIHFDVGLFRVPQRSESAWMIVLSFVLTRYPWKWTPSGRRRHRISFYLMEVLFRYFLKYGKPILSIGDRHEKVGTSSLFNFSNRWSMLNVSASWLLKLQLSRLFFTRSVDVSHFEIASVSTGAAENESKWKKYDTNNY